MKHGRLPATPQRGAGKLHALCDNGDMKPLTPPRSTMAPSDAFRRFQEELAALDSKLEQKSSKTSSNPGPDDAKSEFLALCKRYKLTIADVVAFFPEEEGIAYLQQLISANEAKPSRAKKAKPSSNEGSAR